MTLVAAPRAGELADPKWLRLWLAECRIALDLLCRGLPEQALVVLHGVNGRKALLPDSLSLRDQMIISMRRNGHDLEAIAIEAGLSISSVWRVLDRHARRT